jgi:drug/metabolite transporter (DMT)-like permease
MPRHELTAVLCAVAGACLWGVVWYPLNVLEELRVMGLWKIFLIYLAVSVTALPFLIHFCRKRSCSFAKLPTVVLVVFGGLTNLLFFLALTETSVVRALMFFYLSPIWNLLLSRAVKGHPLTRRKFLVILLSLLGTVILLGIFHQEKVYWNLGDTYGLLSGLCFAFSVLGLQATPRTPSWALTVVHWFGTVFLAFFAILLWEPTPPPWEAWRQWLPLLLGFSFGIQAAASFLILFSLTRLESYRVNILMLFEIVVGSLTYALWSMDRIQFHEWMGITLIILASLLDNIKHRRQLAAAR